MPLASAVKIERDTSAPPNPTPQNAPAPPKSPMALMNAYPLSDTLFNLSGVADTYYTTNQKDC